MTDEKSHPVGIKFSLSRYAKLSLQKGFSSRIKEAQSPRASCSASEIEAACQISIFARDMIAGQVHNMTDSVALAPHR